MEKKMMRKWMLWGIIGCLLVGGTMNLHGERVAILEEVLKPEFLIVDNDRFYIIENFSILIFDLKDCRFVKRFGKKGEGPREFMGFIRLAITPEYLLINSHGKVSFFTKDGEYIKEMKPSKPMMAWFFKPIGEQFIGYGFAMQDKLNYRCINLLNGKLEKIKELARFKFPVQRSGKINPIAIPRRPKFFVKGKLVFLQSPVEGMIDCYDIEGNKVSTIDPGLEAVKFTKEDEKKYLDFFKTNTLLKNQYERMKHRIQFSETYPVLRDFQLVDDRLYILTYKRVGVEFECLVLDLEGKLLKRAKVPVLNTSPLQSFPFGFKGGNYYQVIENEETEENEMHITRVM